MHLRSLRHRTMPLIAITVLALLAAAFLIFTPPPPPLGSSETPSTPSSVTLTRAVGTVTASWDAPGGATKYHVTYSSDGMQSWSAAPCGTGCTGVSVTIDADNSKSYVSASAPATSTAGAAGATRTQPAPTVPPPPSAPSSVGRHPRRRNAHSLRVFGQQRHQIPYYLQLRRRAELDRRQRQPYGDQHHHHRR